MISMLRFSAYSRILSDWLCVDYSYCSVDMRTYCAARNSVISPLPSNLGSGPIKGIPNLVRLCFKVSKGRALMSEDHFWLTAEQFSRLEPLLPADTRSKLRVDDHRG